MKVLTAEQALKRAEELCVKAERSSGEIEQKLRQWGVPDRERAAIVQSLIGRRFVDDSRFARAYVRDKLRFSHWGRLKIAQALRLKGVARDTAAEAMGEIDPEEYSGILSHLLQVKQRSIAEPDSYEGRMKLLRFAASRGFEPALAAKLLKE